MKEKFLKDLEKKLSVLSDEEKKDIINEYSDIIDEKIKHGKSEEEAINEFGDIKELSKEILKAYKINPDYNKSEFSEKTNDFIKSSEDLIKKGAQKLADVTEEVVDNLKGSGKEFDAADIFEIIIKILIVLVALAFLRIPFYIIGEIGEGIFNIGLFPLNNVFLILWKIFVWVIYVVVCVLLIMFVVNKYTKNNTSYVKKDDIKKEKPIKSTKNEPIKDEVKPKKVEKENNDAFGNFLSIFLKIWCVILIFIPLWCMQIGLICGICAVIYLIIKGIEIYGILLLLLGISGMIGYFTDIIWKLLFSKGKLHVFPIFLNIVLIVLGGILTFDFFTNLTYSDNLPSKYKEVKSTYNVIIDEKTYIDDVIDKYIDNSLNDNELRFEVTYYDGVYNITEPTIIEMSNEDRIKTIKHFNHQEFRFNNKYVKKVIDDLKHKKIYNYSLVDDITIKVFSNEKTKELYE